MITTILLYTGTILLYEWVVLFAGVIPNLFLGLINNSTGGLFPPFSKFAFVLNTLPAIAILFLADWIWRISAGCSIPVVILPILAVVQLRNIRAPARISRTNTHNVKIQVWNVMRNSDITVKSRDVGGNARLNAWLGQ
jgi:hypothetical protein